MKLWLPPFLWLTALLAITTGLPLMEPVFAAWGKPALVYPRESLLLLLKNHLALVLLSGLLAAAVSIAAGIAVTRPWGRDFLPLASRVASIGQTFPPVAVLALAVPAIGFGDGPTLVALFLFGLLPILRNTLAGLDGIDRTITQAATAMGMSPGQVLLRVELPLARRVILAGVRTAVTINIATAAIGSTIGARTLGDPIVAGLVNGNTAYVLQGAVLVGLLALTVESLFEALERQASRSTPCAASA
ncbi:ABC transporter permease [Marinobacter sp. X15-166B]|uniref:ABC transporter permease n=1 Tax=Marinobacter sp. X15-166B TaxID=1897620 RepID=UPI00085C98D7|nr:ABC transporter permease [Marinobacter sp. X15-166B]OEY65506.1 osmoprotectant uptake system permease [Marinobacter sp. X15-166B]